MSPLAHPLQQQQKQQQQQTVTRALFPVAAVGQNKPQGAYSKKTRYLFFLTETSFSEPSDTVQIVPRWPKVKL